MSQPVEQPADIEEEYPDVSGAGVPFAAEDAEGPSKLFIAPRKEEEDTAQELQPFLFESLTDTKYDFRPVPVDANREEEEEEEDAPKE
jgi:hypothetical protein